MNHKVMNPKVKRDSDDGRRSISNPGRRYFPVLVLYARKWAGNSVEDVVQDAFLKLIQYSGRNQVPNDIFAWLLTVVCTTAIDFHRKQKLRDSHLDRLAQNSQSVFEEQPENRLEAKEVVEK